MRHLPFLLLLMAFGCGEKEVAAPEGETREAPAADATAATPEDTARPEPVDSAAEAAAATDSMRDKLVALAVASECLRRGNTPPEQAANTMLALYKAHDIDLDTYTREMSELASDPSFQREIEERTESCPEAPEADADAGSAEVEETETVDAGAAEETADGDTGADGGPGDVVSAEVVDTVVEDTVIVDTAPEIEDTARKVEDTRPEAEVADAEDEVSYTGVWTGRLYGAATKGTLRITIRGRRITSAVATFGRTSIRLKGSISEKGALNLGGTSGDNFIRIGGKVQRGKRGINGTWDGVIDRRKSNGRFILKR